MSASNTAMTASTSPYATGGFWEGLWRASGLNFVLFFIIAYALCGFQPQVGASADALAAFYGGERVRILIAATISGLAMLNLLWFVGALRTTLADAGRDGWGGAVTASSTAFAALFFLLIAVDAAFAYSITAARSTVAPALNDFAWAGVVLSSFPRAMLIMSGTFGLWRAKLISNSLFAAGVAALLLVLAGGTTWMSEGFWAPDGAYSRFVSPIIGIVWVLVVSRILLSRSPATRTGW